VALWSVEVLEVPSVPLVSAEVLPVVLPVPVLLWAEVPEAVLVSVELELSVPVPVELVPPNGLVGELVSAVPVRSDALVPRDPADWLDPL